MITPEPGAVIAGRYTLMHLLGRGGMGSVWLARHRDLEIDVAVKLMAPALVASADARMRFEREARVAAPLNSQHVVRVHDYGVEDGAPYIVMEVLRGESLSARLARQKRIAPAAAAPLLLQICKALSAAHEAGLVHRDLKPANVFLALQDKEEVVKVLDFGIAKSSAFGEASAETATGMMLGSAHYMSPEQIRSSKQVDHRSDLWSVGVILYRMLTGQLPFTGVDLGDVLVRVCTDACARPSSIAPELPAGVDEFFERALARFPVQRFQSAMALAAAFDAVLSRSPGGASIHAVGRNGTISMRPPLPALAAEASESPRESAPTAEWKPIPVDDAVGRVPVAAPEPVPATSASPDVNPASISAVLIVARRAEPSPAIPPPVARYSTSRKLAVRYVAGVTGVLAITGTIALRLFHFSASPDSSVEIAATVGAPPAAELTPVAATTTLTPPAPAPTAPVLPPAVPVAPTPSVRTPDRRPPKRVPATPATPSASPPQPPIPQIALPPKHDDPPHDPLQESH